MYKNILLHSQIGYANLLWTEELIQNFPPSFFVTVVLIKKLVHETFGPCDFSQNLFEEILEWKFAWYYWTRCHGKNIVKP